MASYLLVHGGFSGGWYWGDVARALEGRGHEVAVIDQLPSAGMDPRALGDLQADAAAVREAIDAVGKPVVLVGHSSAGVVLTEVADHPAIAHSVYVAAFWPPRGRSVLDMVGDGPPPSWWFVRDDGAMQISDDLDKVREALCADVDPARAAECSKRLVLQSMSSIATPSAAPERKHPTTFVILERDQAVPPAAQEQMATAADHIERLASSHQPMLSMPDKLAAVLSRVA